VVPADGLDEVYTGYHNLCNLFLADMIPLDPDEVWADRNNAHPEVGHRHSFE
jgi:lambda repressor-like predicted transcriptional regulator